jgi:hypothetical protein
MSVSGCVYAPSKKIASGGEKPADTTKPINRGDRSAPLGRVALAIARRALRVDTAVAEAPRDAISPIGEVKFELSAALHEAFYRLNRRACRRLCMSDNALSHISAQR